MKAINANMVVYGILFGGMHPIIQNYITHLHQLMQNNNILQFQKI